jgi:hypothetical protein
MWAVNSALPAGTTTLPSFSRMRGYKVFGAIPRYEL